MAGWEGLLMTHSGYCCGGAGSTPRIYCNIWSRDLVESKAAK